VRLAKLRWRIELDYRELKDALGLDHFEGRSFRGWNHHVTLVSVAHGFLTLHASTQKRMRRPEPVRRPARAAAADSLLRPAPARPVDAGYPARPSSCTRRHDHT